MRKIPTLIVLSAALSFVQVGIAADPATPTTSAKSKAPEANPKPAASTKPAAKPSAKPAAPSTAAKTGGSPVTKRSAPVRKPPLKKASTTKAPLTKTAAPLTKTATPDGKPIWLTLKAGLPAAKSSGKPVIVDVFTDWCHWCHKLDKDVLSVDPVSPYLAKNFVCIRINAEDQGDGQNFAQKLGVNAYPTMVFLDTNGNPLAIAPGYSTPPEFLKKLEKVAEAHKNGVRGKPIAAAEGAAKQQ